MDDKKALLEQLKLDRADGELPSRGRTIVVGFAVVAFLLVTNIGLLVFSGSNSDLAPEVPEAAAGPAAAAELPAAAAEPPAARDEARAPAPAPQDDGVLNAAGYVTARRVATVSAEITGRVSEILVEEGMKVDAGQVVARLDDALVRLDYQLAEAEVLAAQAGVKSAQANLAEAKRVLGRTRKLKTREFSSHADFTRAESAVLAQSALLAQAQAELELARLRVDRVRERIDDHIIRAPFAGVVVQKNAQPGEIVAPGSAGGGFTRTGVCTLVDMNSLEIEIDVNERFIGRVSENQRVQARLHAYPDWVIPGRVIAIVPTADRERATVKVRIAFDRSDPRILPDMGVSVTFLTRGSGTVGLKE